MYNSPAERLKELLHPFKRKYHKDFWALRDISLEIPKGATFGIIGQNGSGKSTLLQVICGILQPTAGSVQVNGRISALLELGAGFNRDFTGRENVFMNGAVIGISRDEMEERFERIAEFADIGHFIDQPVKTYSSGMYVRLAFSVAINVDPDILIVDEALAVGDIKFQRKCFSKLEDFKEANKTILFVSHSHTTINNLCNAAILLGGGTLLMIDEPRAVTMHYHQLMFGEDIAVTAKSEAKTSMEAEQDSVNLSSTSTINESMTDQDISKLDDKQLRQQAFKKLGITEKKSTSNELRHGSGDAEIIDFGILDRAGIRVNYLTSGDSYSFFFRTLFYKDFRKLFLAFVIRDVQGIELFYTNTEILKISVPGQKRGSIMQIGAEVAMNLAPGQYFLSFVSLDSESSNYLDRRLDAFHFIVRMPKNNGGGFVNLRPEMQISNI